jgi:Methylase involved in ubiquinone/menaquinone biosynthesis
MERPMKEHDRTSRHDKIRQSYRELGELGNIYDGIITRSTITGKVMDSLIWGLDGELSAKWIDDALAPIPADFSGKLLEVPVGTGVLTMPLYASLPKAGVTCHDYSADMMENAKKRAAAMGLSHVAFIQGDVGALPFEDESFDIVLSLNGFHAFPDKDAAFRETFRVLRKSGVFCGCFYIAGEFRRTDWFVKHMYVPKGFFTPPFETRESLEARLRSLYSAVDVHAVRAEGIFRCVK